MNPRLLIPVIASIATLFFAGCEQPNLRGQASTAEIEEKETTPSEPAITEQPTIAESKEEQPEAEPQPESKKESKYESEQEEGELMVIIADPDIEQTLPDLFVVREDDTIIITGAIRSKSQANRIGDQMTAAFPKLTVQNRLVVDYNRMGVSWTGRVADAFLIPFFTKVNDPEFSYIEGIITLKGKIDDQSLFREFQQLATSVFASAMSRDIDNQLY